MDARLRQLPYWEALTASEQELVRSASEIRHCPTGSLLHGNCDGGGSCLGMLMVTGGVLRTCILSQEGREITLFRLSAGDCCVLSAACILSQIDFDTQLSVEEEAEVLIVPAAVYARLTEGNLQVRCFTYELAARHFSAVMQVFQQILFSRFDARLAAFLLREAGSNGGVLHMTQEQIAQNVNSAREVVGRTLKRFAAAGLIENRRGMLTVRNAAGLERLLD